MKWIDEMFATMEKDGAAASAKRIANAAQDGGTEHHSKQIPGASDAWSTLVASITNDLNDFNKHKQRARQTAVRISQRGYECEIYLPGMHGKRMVLTLDNNDLQVSVHPDFPRQQFTITIKPDKDGQHGFWVLGEPAQQNGKLSAEQLSEYLLKPIFISADIDQ